MRNILTLIIFHSLPFRSGVRMILICNIFPYSIKREEEKREKEKKEKE
jgi:hypothetical protein